MPSAPTPVEVAALVARRIPEWAGLPVEPVSSDGTVNAIFRVGEVGSVRIPFDRKTPAGALLEGLTAEAERAREFATASPIPAPVPVATGGPDDGFERPWSAQTWVPGTVATPSGSAESVALAEDLAALISALRRVDTRGRRFGDDADAPPGRGGHLPDHDAWVSACLRASTGLVDTERIGALWARLRSLPRADPDAMVHGDLTPPNLLVESHRLVGVLDTGGFGPADPALDLVAAWHLLDAGPRAVLRDRLGCSDLAWRRGAAWALEQALGLVEYYAESIPGMSALGRSTLERLLDDPDL